MQCRQHLGNGPAAASNEIRTKARDWWHAIPGVRNSSDCWARSDLNTGIPVFDRAHWRKTLKVEHIARWGDELMNGADTTKATHYVGLVEITGKVPRG